MTLEELNAQLAPRFKQIAEFHAQQIAQAKDDWLWLGGKPLTKWQRRKLKAQRFLRRFKLAWMALKGADLIENY
jgi:hypothetical protein